MSAAAVNGPDVGGARRETTLAVLFADVSDSSRLYSVLGDLQARSVVEAAIRVLTEVLPHHGGRLIKTIGDAVMCVFESADRAVGAACEMQSRIASRPVEGQRLAIHAGLHFGPVLVEQGDVFGNTVNAAAHLCAVAAAGQVLITDATEGGLADDLRANARPVFYASLKGCPAESTIHQVLWQRDRPEITSVNLRATSIIPPDPGGLVLTLGDRRVRVDPGKPLVTLGRGSTCDLPVADRCASRMHAVITLRRTHFYLSDQSINGSFVRMPSGSVVQVLKNDILLDAIGEISLGRPFDEKRPGVIRFTRDRRALFRA